MNIKNVFAILLCSTLLSCASVKISDNEFCGDIGESGASCFKTLSGETRDIPKNEWDDYRFGMICSNADTFTEWKKAILKLCKLSKRCTFEVKKKVNKFGKNVEKIKLKIKEEEIEL